MYTKSVKHHKISTAIQIQACNKDKNIKTTQSNVPTIMPNHKNARAL